MNASTQPPCLKLSTVFIAVLALHVLVIGGFMVCHLMAADDAPAQQDSVSTR